MTQKKNDLRLGMDCSITRRDFLNGVAVGAGMLAMPNCLGPLSAPTTSRQKRLRVTTLLP